MNDRVTYIIRFEKFDWKQCYYREAKFNPLQITTAMIEGEVPPPNHYTVDYRPMDFKNTPGNMPGQVVRFFIPDEWYNNFKEIAESWYYEGHEQYIGELIKDIQWRDDAIANHINFYRDLMISKNPLKIFKRVLELRKSSKMFWKLNPKG
ncbi:MAG: hypothetical protein AB1690_02525 [Candidatus Zixiibacteriota bacterium]